jgi:hypothetical protein
MTKDIIHSQLLDINMRFCTLVNGCEFSTGFLYHDNDDTWHLKSIFGRRYEFSESDVTAIDMPTHTITLQPYFTPE